MDTSNDLASLQPTDLDAGQVFSGKPSGTAIRGYATASAYTPAIDPGYVFHESSRDMVVWFLSLREPLYIFSPSGCGKTICIKQLAARLIHLDKVFEEHASGGNTERPTLEPILSDEQVKELRAKLKKGGKVAALAREYGVSKQTVYFYNRQY